MKLKTMNLNEDQVKAVEDIVSATALARKVFLTVTPTAEMILTCHDVVYAFDSGELQHEAARALEACGEIAHNITNNRDPETVFGILNVVFPDFAPLEDDINMMPMPTPKPRKPKGPGAPKHAG